MESEDDGADTKHYVELIEAGLADAEAGRIIDHSTVCDWLRTWGSDNENEPPIISLAR